MAATLNWILGRLGEADRRRLLARARHRPLEIGQTIFKPGDQVDQVWFPDAGVISVIAESEDGQQAEAGLTGPEGAAGLLECLGSGTMASLGVVQAAGAAWTVPAADCRAFNAENADFRFAAQLATEFHAIEARQSLFCRCYHPAEARLARWLLEVLDRSATSQDGLLLTQEVMAALLGVQRTTVSTTVAKLRRDGVLASGRGRLDVRDKPRLEALACSCRAALAAENRRIHTLGRR